MSNPLARQLLKLNVSLLIASFADSNPYGISLERWKVASVIDETNPQLRNDRRNKSLTKDSSCLKRHLNEGHPFYQSEEWNLAVIEVGAIRKTGIIVGTCGFCRVKSSHTSHTLHIISAIVNPTMVRTWWQTVTLQYINKSANLILKMDLPDQIILW